MHTDNTSVLAENNKQQIMPSSTKNWAAANTAPNQVGTEEFLMAMWPDSPSTRGRLGIRRNTGDTFWYDRSKAEIAGGTEPVQIMQSQFGHDGRRCSQHKSTLSATSTYLEPIIKNNDFEYFTYEADELGVTDVYGWTRYTNGPLIGQPRKMFLQLFQSVEDARIAYPHAYDTHPAFE